MNIKNILGFGIDKQLHVPSLISIDDLGLGEDVTDKALTIASFWKGVNIISNSIASFPFRIYKDKEIQRSSDLYYLLKHKPNEFQTSFEFFNTMILIMLLKGNSFALIVRDDKGTPVAFDIISFNYVEAIIFDGKLYFKFDGNTNKTIIPSEQG